MTQARQRTRTTVRRLGSAYGIDVIDHDSWMAGTPVVVPNDYIGQTTQKGRARENQHRDDKPWSDLIVGSSHVLWEGVCTKGQLDEVERSFIQNGVNGVRPRLNWLLNEDNPEQIPIPRQVEQRWARDDKAGRPRWVPLEERGAQGLLDQQTAPYSFPPAMVTRPATPKTRGLLVWSASWLLLTTLAYGYLTTAGLTWTVRLAVSASIATVMCIWGLLGAPISRRQRRAVRKRLSRNVQHKIGLR